jgi:hypothetical protein
VSTCILPNRKALQHYGKPAFAGELADEFGVLLRCPTAKSMISMGNGKQKSQLRGELEE